VGRQGGKTGKRKKTTYEYNKLCYPAVSEHVIRHKNLVASHGEPLDLANGYINRLESHRIGRDVEHEKVVNIAAPDYLKLPYIQFFSARSS